MLLTMCQSFTDCAKEQCSNRMGVSRGMRGASSLGEVGLASGQVSHYASTPHLFVYQPVEEEEVVCHAPNKGKEPIYSSAVDIRKQDALKEAEAVKRITEQYEVLPNATRRHSSGLSVLDMLAVTEEDICRIETFFKGLKTQVWVCRTMANLYYQMTTGTSTSWELKFTGVPLLLLDGGDTRSRDKRSIQLVLAEKATGFALWKDIVDNLTSYRVQEPNFHTFYLSSDHRRKIGLSFNDGKAALEFHGHLERLTGDPANISLSTPGKKKSKEKPPKYRAPKKMDISIPCNFYHVTNIEQSDETRLYSLQNFSNKCQSQVKSMTIMEKAPLPAMSQV